MSLKRQYKLNMPQLLWGGLSENWLLKELGDVHWQQITNALNTASDQLTDSRGERLYASFVRLHWSGANISKFAENDSLELQSKLSRYGSKMFFSETDGVGTSGAFKANLMSVFSTREASDNTKLKKGALKAEIDSDAIKLHSKLPPVAKEYLENKSGIFDENNQLKPEGVEPIIYQKEYIIDAYDDINGVGLLYFASYPKINDKCEREYIKNQYQLKGDWLEIAGVISRDIHYYGNANSGDKLIYELNKLEQKKDEVTLHSSLYRAKDQQLIAKVYTTKQLKNSDALEAKKEPVVVKQQDLKIKQSKIDYKTPITLNAKPLTDLDKKTLNTIVLQFLKSVLEVDTLTKDTKLNELGIESIIYQELSEYLYENHKIDSNPSRFYGTESVDTLTNYLLGIETSTIQNKRNGYSASIEEDIAIVGISGRFPGAPNLDTYWENLKANKNTITEVSTERWDWKTFNKNPEETTTAKWGGFIEGVGNFDPLFFGISPFEAELMDPQQRITLESVYTALEDANIVPSALKGTNTGVYIGVSGSDYAHISGEARKGKAEAYDAIGTASSILANRISYLLNIHGPSQAIDTACSSSLVAVDQAVKSIKNGTSDIAIAGGVHTMLRPELTVSYSQAGMLSVDGQCKTFDNEANGYVRGEGVGIVVLKKLSKAEQDGDYIYGVIKGSAVNHGGKANTLTSPNPEAQKALLIEAYTSGDIDPRDVSYIEAHGTGTPLGDPIEIEGLKLAFNELYKEKNIKPSKYSYCGIGSAKTNIGHLEAGAGIAGLLKVLLCIKNKTLPGNPNLKTQNKYINLKETPFHLRTETTPWTIAKNKTRIAGVSSFGFGGVNAHVVLEEYKNKQKVYKSLSPALIILSAKNNDRLKEKAIELKKHLQSNLVQLHDLAYTLQYGREEMEERLAFKAETIDDVITKLNSFLEGDTIDIATGNSRKDNCSFLLEGEAGQAYMDIVISKKEFTLLAELWVKGTDLNWEFLYGKTIPNKITLPTYPFAKQYYWVSKPEQETVETTNTKTKVLEIQASIEETVELTTEEKVKNFLMTVLKKVLKLDEKDIDFTLDIGDYGIDSIMSGLMIADIREVVAEVPPLLFMEYRTFNDIVEYLVADFGDNFNDIKQSAPVVKEVIKVVKETLQTENILPQKEAEPQEKETENNAIAIIGVNGILPQSENTLHFFEHLEKGDSLTEKIPQKRLDLLGLKDEERKQIAKFYGGFIDGIEYFDYKKFKFTKEEAIQIDPQLRKLIESVWNAIGDSGYKVKDFQKKETGVFVATTGNSGYLDVMKREAQEYEVETPALYANRLSHVFNLKGPSQVVDTACSSFIAAMERASHAFQRGDCKQAIVATATLNLSSHELIKEDLTGIYSKSGETKSFSEDADGFVRSETIGSIVVKPLSEAEKDGDYIYGVVKGIGVYHGGKAPLKWNSPNIKGQKKAIEKAIAQAKIDPLTIDYIEAEANGVSFVDTSEMVSIQSVYGNYFKNPVNGIKDKTIYVGSLKPLMGHAETSSTFPCLLKLIASTQNKKLYGVKGLSQINGAITLDKHFSILKNDIDWQTLTDNPKRMAMNCLGIGGVNTHLIFEEYQNKTTENVENEREFSFIFSDENEEQLTKLLEQFVIALPKLKDNFSTFELLNRLEFTLQEGRHIETCRLAIITNTYKDLLESIKAWLLDKNAWADNKQRFYNANKIEAGDAVLVQEAYTTKDIKALTKYWTKGAVIQWSRIQKHTSILKRIPVPTTTLKTTYCWPFSIKTPIQNKIKMRETDRPKPIYDLIKGQTESPYKINNNHLFLFDLKWDKVESNTFNEATTTVLEQHAILCYIDTVTLKDINGLVVPKPEYYNEKTYTELVNNVFLYIQNVIKQKPRHTVSIQIILPKSCIDNSYGLTGLVHSTRQESTKVKPQLIFVEDTVEENTLHTILKDNIANLDIDRIIKYEGKTRYVEYTSPINIINKPIKLEKTYKSGDVILVTGGLGGLGIAMTKNILKHSKYVTIVLVGRSILDKAKSEKLKELNNDTNKVVYYDTDISKEKEVKNLIQKILRIHQKLDGVIHCAGVIRDNYIMKKTVEEIKTVFEPKVYGAKYIDEHTKDIALRFFLCFSSLHSLGNAGQADYAMANAYLDGFIRARNKAVKNGRRQGQSITMNWPYWAGGGMQLSEIAIDLMTGTKGSVPMPTEIGAELMHYAIQLGQEQMFVDLGDYNKIIKQHNIDRYEAKQLLI